MTTAIERIVLISDTHGLHGKVAVPPGDLLVHAGDCTRRGGLDDLEDFARFMGALPHRHKVVIAGNHDFCFERPGEKEAARALMEGLHYLEDDEIVIEGLRIYGSPWQPRFFDWAFNLDRGEPLRRVWAKIPEGTDILVTHGPPLGVVDMTRRGDAAGCEALRARVEAVRPRLHVCGHIHEAYGHGHLGETLVVNASTCTLSYKPTQAPVVYDWHQEALIPT